MKPAWILILALIAGCASQGGTSPGGASPATRQFEAPVARVKPAFISTLASMGMMISALEVRGGVEVIKARKAGGEVEIELESLSRTRTRARVASGAGTLLRDEPSRILRQVEKLLGGT